MTSEEPGRVDCPDCGTRIVLLPLKLYASAEGVDPGDISDVVGHKMEAVFALVDDEGCYTCPACQRAHRVEP